MESKPILKGITIYPIKSLDGISLDKATISKGGCLLHDREYAISDAEGNFIIGKTNPLVHSLRSTFNFENETVSLRRNSESIWKEFHISKEKSATQSFLSDYFGFPILLHQNTTGRFMDIPDISGVTVLSAASLQSISSWYSGIDAHELRKRFRATLEIDGVPPFWEDHLFSKEGRGIEFRVGPVTMFGMSPRARCVVPTRNPETGEITPAFPKIFAKHRAGSLPEWSSLKEYGHHYHLTVNCYVPSTEIGKCIEVGNEVEIKGEKIFY